MQFDQAVEQRTQELSEIDTRMQNSLSQSIIVFPTTIINSPDPENRQGNF
jgi:hypothetical protein